MTLEEVLEHLGYPNPDAAPGWVRALAEMTHEAMGLARKVIEGDPDDDDHNDDGYWLAMAKQTLLAVLVMEGMTGLHQRLMRRMDERLSGGLNVFEHEGHAWVDMGHNKRTLAAADQLVRLGVWAKQETADLGVFYRPLRKDGGLRAHSQKEL